MVSLTCRSNRSRSRSVLLSGEVIIPQRITCRCGSSKATKFHCAQLCVKPHFCAGTREAFTLCYAECRVMVPKPQLRCRFKSLACVLAEAPLRTPIALLRTLVQSR